MANYSRTWFDTFLHTMPEEQSDTESEFLAQRLPLSRFTRVLDLCCGAGRHAVRLARMGYRVTAVDRDRAVLENAPRATPTNPEYVAADIRHLSGVGSAFDAAVIMWQSFGFLAPDDNDKVLGSISSILSPGGRLILDLYHRDFFAAHEGTRVIERAGTTMVETKTMEESQLKVKLEYEDGTVDKFSWELFTPSEIATRAASVGFGMIGVCGGFDAAQPPSPTRPRFQVVFETT